MYEPTAPTAFWIHYHSGATRGKRRYTLARQFDTEEALAGVCPPFTDRHRGPIVAVFSAA